MSDFGNPWHEDVDDVIDPMEILDVRLAQLGCPYVGCNGKLPEIVDGVGTQFCQICENPCYPMPDGVYVTDDEFTRRHDALCET